MSEGLTISGKIARPAGSLIERAAEHFDFSVPLRGDVATAPVSASEPPLPEQTLPEQTLPEATPPADEPPSFAGDHASDQEAVLAALPEGVGMIDRERLAEEGFIVPDAPPSALAEEFRLVKRRLLRTAPGVEPRVKDRMVMICSAQPDEGKTFCSVNLALSLASERDTEVLLVDADLAKPEILSTLGLAGTAGLMDAIADPAINVEDLIIQTDVPKLTVLPAGRATNDDTELLSSARAVEVLRGLAVTNPRRIVIIDSAPALAASPASALAHHVGRIVMVVRADRTTESELRDAIALLDGCPDISLLLNGASYFGSNRTFGSYYGQEK